VQHGLHGKINSDQHVLPGAAHKSELAGRQATEQSCQQGQVEAGKLEG
jgi:hypothetical protein